MKALALILLGTWSIHLPSAFAGNAERSVRFFNQLDKDHLALVDDFYDKNVQFQDAVHQITGSQAVKAYYEGLYKNVQAIRFDFSKTITEGDTVVLVWKMVLTTPKLNGGKEFSVDGTSVITFGGSEGKAIAHRDFFDMGEFVYERIPILKNIILMIKGKLASH